MLNLVDKKIRKSFSRASVEYDLLSSLHKEIGRELSNKIINNDNLDSILDIGMGTGWLTNRVKFFLPESKIIGLDFAPGMISEASRKYHDLDIVQATATNLPFKQNAFDLIISNLAYQWVKDFKGGFQQCYDSLKPEGKMYFTMFGYNTFSQMFESFEKMYNHEKPWAAPFRRLASKEEVFDVISKIGFKDVKTDYEIIKVRFLNLIGLMKWIKDIGANSLWNGGYIGKDWVSRASKYYDDHYKDRLGLYASFEVIWIEAHK